MRSQVFGALVGVLVLAATVACAPALSYNPSVSTVYGTVSSFSTVNPYQALPQTVYVTLPCNFDSDLSASTTTLTRVNTLLTTTTTTTPTVDAVILTASVTSPLAVPEGAATTEAPQHNTVTETTVIFVSDVQLIQLQSGASFTYSETASSNGLLDFIVENGTTYWLNGQTPTLSEPYLVQTSVVTAVPINTATSTFDKSNTVTLEITIFSTHEFTITETLPTPSPNNLVSGYLETGSRFTVIATGGWNETSTAWPGVRTEAIVSPSSPTILSLEAQDTSFNIYTTYSIVTSTSLAAQAGFKDITATSVDSSTATAGGAYTAHIPPYANRTSSAQGRSTSAVSASSPSSALGTAVKQASRSTQTSYTYPPLQFSNSTTISSSSAAKALSSISVTSSNRSSTSVLSTASATPSTCGEVGNFTLNFDDIPPLSVSNEDQNDAQPEPVFNPYHQFDFSDGFVVVPPPTVPYLPSSKPLFVEFIPNFNINGTNTMAGPNTLEDGYSGDIGNGDHGLTGCFGFNVYGASFGCDSKGPNCNFLFTGFRYDPGTGSTNAVASQVVAVQACPTLSNCTLTPVILNSVFEDLDSIRINVTVASAPKIWWVDDLHLGWYNNTCSKGLCRQTAHIS